MYCIHTIVRACFIKLGSRWGNDIAPPIARIQAILFGSSRKIAY